MFEWPFKWLLHSKDESTQMRQQNAVMSLNKKGFSNKFKEESERERERENICRFRHSFEILRAKFEIRKCHLRSGSAMFGITLSLLYRE